MRGYFAACAPARLIFAIQIQCGARGEQKPRSARNFGQLVKSFDNQISAEPFRQDLLHAKVSRNLCQFIGAHQRYLPVIANFRAARVPWLASARKPRKAKMHIARNTLKRERKPLHRLRHKAFADSA